MQLYTVGKLQKSDMTKQEMIQNDWFFFQFK